MIYDPAAQIQERSPYRFELNTIVRNCINHYFDKIGTSYISDNVDGVLREIDARFITGYQKPIDVVIIGNTANGDVIGVTCDYTEVSFPLTLTNKYVIMKKGNFLACTLTLNGDCVFEQRTDGTVTNRLGTVQSLINTRIKFNSETFINNIVSPLLHNIDLINFSQNINFNVNNGGGFMSFYSSLLESVNVIFGGISCYNTTIGNIPNCNGSINLKNSNIGFISNGITGNLTLDDSIINDMNANGLSGIIRMNNSTINNIATIANNKIISRNSNIGLLNGSLLSFTNGSDITLYPFESLISGATPVNVIFGDGSTGNDFMNCNIRCILNTSIAPFYQFLSISDNPNGAGTTYKNNIFEVEFGEQATFNLSGGSTNILKRTGKLSGITDTANNYTKFNTCY